MTHTWRCICNFSSHRWDDGAVIYDCDSGDTHHLTLPALQLLQTLQQTPQTSTQLATRFLAEDAPSAEDVSTIDAIIDNLHDLGLIEPAIQ